MEIALFLGQEKTGELSKGSPLSELLTPTSFRHKAHVIGLWEGKGGREELYPAIFLNSQYKTIIHSYILAQSCQGNQSMMESILYILRPLSQSDSNFN